MLPTSSPSEESEEEEERNRAGREGPGLAFDASSGSASESLSRMLSKLSDILSYNILQIQYNLVSTNTRGPSKCVRLIRNSYFNQYNLY